MKDFPNKPDVPLRRYQIRRLLGNVSLQLAPGRRTLPPPVRHPLVTSDQPCTSQGASGSGMGGSEGRSGAISVPETLSQEQSISVSSDGDTEQKQMLQQLLSRIDKLEEKTEAYEQKLALYEHVIDELKHKNLELEQENRNLRDEMTARLDIIENRSGESGHTSTASSQTIQKLKEDVDRLAISVSSINTQLEFEFSQSFGQGNRHPGLDEIVEELHNAAQNLRNPPQPQCTPWQHWKREACKILKVNTPGDKTNETFSCYDSSCPYKDKTGITLKAYIMHLKNKKYHNHVKDISDKPDLSLLPIVQ